MNSKCHIICISGGKGGVGKSVFAANFALTILLESRSKVLLVDLDQNSAGDLNIITGIRPNKSVRDFVQYNGAINPTTLPALFNAHPSGMFYLSAVKSPDENLQTSADIFIKQLESASSLFDFIIVDIGCDFEDVQMAVLDNASACLLLSTPEILAVNQTRKIFNQFMAATMPTDLFSFVINKATPSALNPESLKQILGPNIIGQIPQDDVTNFAALQRSTPFVNPQARSPIVAAYFEVARRLLGSGKLQKMKASARSLAKPPSLKGNETTDKFVDSKEDPRTLMKIRIHNALIIAMDLKKGITDTQGDANKEKNLYDKTRQSITQIIDKEYPGIDRNERSAIIKEVLDEALGLGPLEELLADDNVSEIMVNGPKQIFAERSGKLTLTSVTFTSNLQLRNVIERIVTPLGRRIDEKNPYVDARLKDGSRVNAVIEPIAIDGPSITIRKFAKKAVTPDDYIKWNSMTAGMIDFLRICVENGLNIIVSGGTGSGKTTLLNVLSSFIPTGERIITVEDAAELQLKQNHVVRLETKPANMEGTGAVSIRDLVKNTLRMRPDRIIVGECRGGEALDMLSAMNTGHDGSMTTVHSNSPREAISRLETLVMMAGMDLPARAIREQVAGAVDLIVQISRLSDGSRKILSITEVVGMQGETVTLQEIFRFKETGFDKNRKIIGQFQAMGLIPSFIEEFERKGIKIPRSLFTSGPNTNSSSHPTATGPGSIKADEQKTNNVQQNIKKASGAS